MGCAGVCCCVARCSLVLPVLCVLLPVVLRVSSGAVLAAFLFPVLPLVHCLSALSCGLVLRRLRPVVALNCCGGVAVLCRVLWVLFCLALVCVVFVSLVWCFSPLWGAVWCFPPPPPPGAVHCFFFSGCVLVVLRPPPPPVGCGVLALSCLVSCGAAVCGVFCVLPGAVWCACVGLGSCALLSGAVLCWVLLCCFCCVLL